MAKIWKEPFDIKRHEDHRFAGGRQQRQVNVREPWAYFVKVAGFTFEFVSLDQIKECLTFYSQKIQPSSRTEIFEPEKGQWQLWSERLPLYLREEPKRIKVVKALTEALKRFQGDQTI